MKKPVLLLGINARYVHSTLSLYYLKQILCANDYPAVIFETTINNSIDDTLESIIALKPSVCCIAVYIWNAHYVKKLLPLIEDNLPQCKIVLGGPEVSYTAESWIEEFPCIGTIVQGPGERSFEYIVQHEFVFNDPTIAVPNYHFNSIPFPYTPEDLQNLANHHIYYESSRGCPYSCSYCLSSRRDQPLQYKDTSTVIEELSVLLHHNIRMVKFVDRTFNCNHTHARAVFQFLLENNNRHTRFHFEIHPELLHDDDFALLRQIPPGYFQFEIGIQSIHWKTLDAIQRPMKWEKAKENIIKLLEPGNIHIHLDMMCGLPLEEMQHIKSSFNTIINAKPHYFQMGFLKILPGTSIDGNKQEFGIVHKTSAPYTVESTNWLSEDDVKTLHRIERIVDGIYNHHFKMTSLMFADYIAQGDMFGLYAAIADFCQDNNIALHAKDWETKASMLLLFITQTYNEYTELTANCLRWDWFVLSNSKRMPFIIRSSSNPNTAREMIIHRHKVSKTHLLIEGALFPINDIKRSQIFIADNTMFRERYCNNRTYALKLPNKEIVYIP